MSKFFKLIEQRLKEGFGNENRYYVVEIKGVRYRASVTRGKRVRQAYSAKFGFKWEGAVWSDRARFFEDEVTKSTGLQWLLECAGLIPLRPSERRKLERKVDNFRRHMKANDEHIARPGEAGESFAAACRKSNERCAVEIENLEAALKSDAAFAATFTEAAA